MRSRGWAKFGTRADSALNECVVLENRRCGPRTRGRGVLVQHLDGLEGKGGEEEDVTARQGTGANRHGHWFGNQVEGPQSRREELVHEERTGVYLSFNLCEGWLCVPVAWSYCYVLCLPAILTCEAISCILTIGVPVVLLCEGGGEVLALGVIALAVLRAQVLL